jgi:hypothetical protein
MDPRKEPPAECANCGAEIPRHAQACPGCGADERTGWRETSVYDGLDLPESAYGDTSARTRVRHGLPWYFVVAAILGILAALVFSFGGR